MDIVFFLLISSKIYCSDFKNYFSEDYIKYYTLWNMDNSSHWKSIDDYRDHAKKQMEHLFNKLWDTQDSIGDDIYGVLEYPIMFYTH